MDRKYEIVSTDSGFVVKDKNTNEVVHEYDENKTWDYLIANADAKSVLENIL